MPAHTRRSPPGPRGWPIIGLTFQVRRDPLGTMRRVAEEYGDIVRLPVALQDRILLNHPDLIEQVLVVQQAKFHKSELTKKITGPLLGQGLLISEGDFWRRQRRLEQPAFHRSRVNEYAATMIESAQIHIREWRDGEVRDVAREMMALTLDVAVRTLFGTTLPGEARHVGHAMTFLMRYQLRRQRSPLRIPENWPTPHNRRARRERNFLDSLVYRIISERQAEGTANHRNDLLSLLMNARDEDGSHMTSQQLRDETMTLFVAGHETTAQMLAWTWHMLGENRAVETRLHEELHQVLGGRPPAISDFARLPYLHAVMSEVLRMYPPAYVIARTAIEPCQLGGYDFPAGSTILMSQWVTHRDSRYYDDPDLFRPERWLEGLANRLPAGAYFPFGDGPRRCIGQGFAMLEAALVIGILAQRFQFRLVPGHPVIPEPVVTLRPRHGIRMTLHTRV
ncbi:MAG: cytochrome P450 [Candidatus Acidiferrales bacterium]